jgi:hypothetical protein
MKKLLFIVSLLLIDVLAVAQSNLTIFSNDGKQFYTIMNGIKQNSAPKTNVFISGIKNGSYAIKIIFADGVTADIDKTVMFDAPSDVTTKIIFKKGKGKLQLVSMVPTQGVLTEPTTVVYRASDASVFTDAVPTNQTVVTTTTTTTTTNNSSNAQNNGNVNGGVSLNMGVGSQATQVNSTQTNVTNQTTTQNSGNMNMNVNVSDQGNQTGTAGMNMSVNVTDPTMNSGTGGISMHVNVTDPAMNSNSGGVNMNVNVNDPTYNNATGGVNMNIDMNGMGMNTNSNTNSTSMNQSSSSSSSTTITTTTTQTSSSSSSSGNFNNNINTTNSNSNYANTGSSSNGSSISCKNILVDDATFVNDIKGLTFDADKVELILGDLKNYCVTANQAYKIVETLTYASDRLDIAKYLYDRMIDKDKSNVLLPLFTFDSDKMEFKEYTKK